MHTASQAKLLAVSLFVVMMVFEEIGFRWGRRIRGREGGYSAATLGALEAPIYGLLGLLLAFAFGAGEARLESRRHEIVQEISSTSTAWARLTLVNPPDVPALQQQFREYFDARIQVFTDLSDVEGTRNKIDHADELQRELWKKAANSVRTARTPGTQILVLNAIDQMSDATTARTVSLDAHTPTPILGLLWILGPITAFLTGHAVSDRKDRSLTHIVLYCISICATFYVIMDLDSARFGRIRLHEEQRMLNEMRSIMK
jgi:hypothetical protein